MPETLPTKGALATINPSATSSIKKIERSTSYPAITIEDALKFVEEVYKNFRTSSTKRLDIASVVAGFNNRQLAASSYYLLLNREKDNYQVSETYLILTNPATEKDRKKAEAEKRRELLRSFYAPKLYKQLVEKFDGDVIPDTLIAHLVRFYGITQDAAPIAADVFLKNAKYCGLLSDDNKLNYKLAEARVDFYDDIKEPPHPPEVNDISEAGIANDDTPINPNQNKNTHQLQLPDMVNREETKIKLTGGKFALLIHPLTLNTTDIQILKKQIEQLELIVSTPA